MDNFNMYLSDYNYDNYNLVIREMIDYINNRSRKSYTILLVNIIKLESHLNKKKYALLLLDYNEKNYKNFNIKITKLENDIIKALSHQDKYSNTRELLFDHEWFERKEYGMRKRELNKLKKKKRNARKLLKQKRIQKERSRYNKTIVV